MLNKLDYPAPTPAAAAERRLLIMLPSAGAHAIDFATRGMVDDAQAANPGLDIVAVEPDLELYLNDGVAEALHMQVVQPARQQGYRRIWMLGISLGGAGALLYAAAHASELEGIFLLAPFLGTGGTIAALARTGGITGSLPLDDCLPAEQTLLTWLRDYAASGGQQPPIYLAFGRNDRLAPGHQMLAKLLPPARVIIRQGGHDWECWRRLLRQLLALQPFGA